MLLNEQKRISRYMAKHYNRYVAENKLTPYERDHRMAVNKKLIDLLTQAVANKANGGPKLLQLLNQIP